MSGISIEIRFIHRHLVWFSIDVERKFSDVNKQLSVTHKSFCCVVYLPTASILNAFPRTLEQLEPKPRYWIKMNSRHSTSQILEDQCHSTPGLVEQQEALAESINLFTPFRNATFQIKLPPSSRTSSLAPLAHMSRGDYIIRGFRTCSVFN